MIGIDSIPFDIIRLIVIRVVSPSVRSVDDWVACMNALAVSRMWRMIGQPLLYSNIVISLEVLHSGIIAVNSNTGLVVSNSFEGYVRAIVIHTTPNLTREDVIAVVFMYIPNSLTANLNMPSIMDRFWEIVGTPTALLGGACIEPLLLAMPNLRYLFVESNFMTDPWMRSMSVFLHYSVARQVSSRISVSWFTEFDLIMSLNHEILLALNSNTAMTRMVLAPTGRGQTRFKSCRLLVPSTDRVLFCAEYIRRLRILDLPQSALSLGTSIDELRDRNPCPPRENDTRWLWYNIRYRSYLYVPNIWFEDSTGGVTRYELFAFNRSANDHLLQIAPSVPPEVSEPANYPDFISDYASSGSDPDDGYFSL